MKQLLLICTALTFFSAQAEEIDNAFVKDPTIAKRVTHIPNINLNPKLKNGLLPKVTSFGDTVGYQFYVNGKKHGPYYSKQGYSFEKVGEHLPYDGYYLNGVKNGHFNRYHWDGSVHYIAYFREGQLLYKTPYPNRIYDYYDGFYRRFQIFTDSIEMRVYHPNGYRWYEGEFINKTPKGLHTMKTTEGKLYLEVNFSDSTIQQYDRRGNPTRLRSFAKKKRKY